MIPFISLRGSDQRVTSHAPCAMMKMKNSESLAAVTSASESIVGKPATAEAAPAESTLRKWRRLVFMVPSRPQYRWNSGWRTRP